MSDLGTILFLATSIVFLVIGLIVAVRLKEAKGSLRLAKISVIMLSVSAAGSFLIKTVAQFAYDPSPLSENLLVKELYVPIDLLAMLTFAFLASFAVFATYAGGRRNLIVSLIFLVALIPPAYLTLTYTEAVVGGPTPDTPESYQLAPPIGVTIAYALCGIPLGVLPLVAFGRSLIIARRRRDKVLSRRSTLMLSAIMLVEGAYLVFVFNSGLVELVSLVASIPAAIFLIFAVLNTTSSAK
jgi:hypothetical protein